MQKQNIFDKILFVQNIIMGNTILDVNSNLTFDSFIYYKQIVLISVVLQSWYFHSINLNGCY